MPKIEFVKVERDCQYNREIPAKSKKRRIIDYDVVIDSQKRAQWHELSFNGGWRLRDTFGDIIWQPPKSESHSRRDITATQLSFFTTLVEENIRLIPTIAELEKMRQEKADAEKREVWRRKIDFWKERVRHNALQMYELIKLKQDVLGEEAKHIIAAIETEETANAEEA